MVANLEAVSPEAAAEALIVPSAFARVALDLDLYPWAEKILDDLMPTGSRVAARCCNGSGKTSRLLVAAILWHMAIFPKSKAVCTAGVWRQVTHQLWPNLRAQKPRLSNWELLENQLRAPNGSSAFGFSTDDPGLFEGWHGSPEEPLLMVIDEAKSVPDGIFEAIERCQPQRILAVSSAGLREGFFYRAFTDQAAEWKGHVVQSRDCPHLGDEWANAMIRRWGRNHPLVKSAVFSEFMDTGDGVIPVIPAENLERLAKIRVPHRRGEKVCFTDFGAGTDETVIAYRDGNRTEIVAAFCHPDTMSTVGQCIRHYRKLGLEPHQTYGDNGGIGKVMCDRMRELGWPIHRVNNEKEARDKAAFINLAGEMWHEGARAVEAQEIILPNDPILMAQLSSRRMKFDSEGRLGVESKRDMAKRNVESPDRADAILGAWWARPAQPEKIDELPTNQPSAAQMAGAYAGM